MKAVSTYSTNKPMLKGILVHINIAGAEPNGNELLNELLLLCETCGIQTMATLQQNLHEPSSATLIGAGKLNELKELCKQHKADVVIFDNDLSGMKKKNIEDVIECNVLTRSMIVLDIFANRAKTAEGKLQVEIAQLKYYMPRLIGMQSAANGRFGAGGVGSRGPGETKLELDKRKIKDRISRLESELKKLAVSKDTSVKKRTSQRVPSVAIVGYTNAGKSTLFNTITKAGVMAQNMLFATLETVTRYVYISPQTQVVLSDTVGFINKLPHEFVQAFKTTLNEARQADVLLIVVDAGSKNAYEEFWTVNKVLEEIGAYGRRIIVLNKCDKQINKEAAEKIEKESPEFVHISAAKNEGIDLLKNKITQVLEYI